MEPEALPSAISRNFPEKAGTSCSRRGRVREGRTETAAEEPGIEGRTGVHRGIRREEWKAFSRGKPSKYEGLERHKGRRPRASAPGL